MKLKTKEGKLLVETWVYQAKNGAIYLDWGNTVIKLKKDDTHQVAYDIPEFNHEDYLNYYK
jgi:urocanate hydratase